MRVLFIAPVPPPINGQSKASKVLLEGLIKEHQVDVVNLSKSSLKNGSFSVSRIFDIFINVIRVWKKSKNKDIIYLSFAESFAGNLRDILFYLILGKKIKYTFGHMLGGAGMKEILAGKGFMKKINCYYMRKLGGVFVEGPVNFETFGAVINKDKIHIVPNFSEDFLFVSDKEIEDKFEDTSVINILYLSNLIPGKGYKELVEAFILLRPDLQKRIRITFVGGFESEKDKENFLNKVNSFSQLNYLGKFIDGNEKRKLYCKSHVFCLPTYYPFEGQPISILEAYATGCFVISSNHSGIPFIFEDGENGIMVEKQSINSLKTALEKLINEECNLLKIAIFNKDEALKKYRTNIFQKAITQILKKGQSPNNQILDN